MRIPCWPKKFTIIHKMIFVANAIGFLVIAYFYYAMFIYVKYGPIIDTPLGKLQSRILESRNGTEYFAFLGVPFAKPPVENLRFETPEDPEGWDDVRDATYFRSPCVHVEIFVTGLTFGAEDCLHLNVFTPKLKGNTTEKLYPVMMYIHGGLFHAGSTDRMGAQYFMDEEVVLVTVNYRLGVFGFLNTGDGVVRGNMGLKDQSKALQWINYNIELFGGDPQRVTIFGESAGGACVNHHLLSPMSRGLFHSAISQSGTSLNEWAINRTPKAQATRFAKKFDCMKDNSNEMVDCLKKINQYELVAAHLEIWNVLYHERNMAFVPTIEKVNDEDAFLAEEPEQLLKSGRFTRVPWITGVNSEDGLMFSGIITASQEKLNEANSSWNEWAPKVLHYNRNDTVSAKIREYYFPNQTEINSADKLDEYTAMLGDRYFNVDASKAADLARKYVPTYIYLNSYKGQYSLADLTPMTEGGISVFINIAWYGFKRIVREYIFREDMTTKATAHTDELLLLFPQQWVPKYQWKGQIDYQMSLDFIKLWVSFATNPTDLVFRGVPWPAINSPIEKQRFLNISNNPDVIDNPFVDQIQFWESLNLPLR